MGETAVDYGIGAGGRGKQNEASVVISHVSRDCVSEGITGVLDRKLVGRHADVLNGRMMLVDERCYGYVVYKQVQAELRAGYDRLTL